MEVSEIAETLGMSKGAVRKAIARGTMKAREIPRQAGERGAGVGAYRYVVDPEEVERYRQEHLGRVLGRPVEKGDG